MESIERVVLKNNVELGYKIINPDVVSSHAIVFLHEGIGSINQWKGFPEKLCMATGLKGVVYDREGYGASSALRQQRDEKYLHQYALEELPAVLDKLNITEDLILFGHSDGASIAFIFGSRYPEEVAAIISEAAHVFVEDVTLEGIDPVVEAFEQNGLYQRLEKYHGEKTRDIFYSWANTWKAERFRSWNIEALLDNIACPVLAIQGDQDQYGTEEQLDSIVKHCNAEKLLVQNCGHTPHVEKQDNILQSSISFISAIV